MNYMPFAISLMLVSLATPAADLGPQRYQETGYFNGGIGVDEREAMAAQAERYNLRMRFANAGSGQYRSDVTLQIRQQDKLLLQLDAAGPLCYVSLPPGRYLVRAVVMGEGQERQVEIPRSGWRELVFYWRFSDQ
jgi:hypothetical protein